MRGKIADCVVAFCGRVDDGLRVMCKAGQMGTVFLAEELFYGFAFFGVVELEGFVGAGGKDEFPRIVEVEGCYRGAWELEELLNVG